jgi:amidophosphoribosyltransferase
MEKQHNRGQDGAGVANIKFDVEARNPLHQSSPLEQQAGHCDIFARIQGKFEAEAKKNPEILNDPLWLKKNMPFSGELWLGHLRYGTYGGNSIEACHPFLRQNNWMTKNLVVAGNFNMTNVDELFDDLIRLGQHPKEKADTVTVMENIGHFLDEENEEMYRKFS